MSGADILNELNGKVSGETRQLYQAFVNPAPKHINEISKDLHKIIATGMANGQEFAIIEKIHTFATIDGKESERRKVFKTDRIYFLSGINDEGTYFVHPLDNDAVKTWWRTGNMQQVLDMINRTGDGFTRIQGDVLVKTFENWELIVGDIDRNGIEDVTLDEHNEHMNLVSRDTKEMEELEKRNFENRLWTVSLWDPSISTTRKTYVDGVERAFDLESGEAIEVTPEQMKKIKVFDALDMTKEEHDMEFVKHETKKFGVFTSHDKTKPKTLLDNPLPIFGNHFLYTDAPKIYAGRNGVLLRGASVVVLEHNEHKTVKFNTDPKTNTFLTTQRGVTAIHGKFVGYD